MNFVLAQLSGTDWMLQWVFGILLSLTGTFLVLLVLVQRGRGGGLSGAFGGMGGQSAFGTKAGDLFTRITVGAAIVWILLCLAAVMFLPQRDKYGSADEPGIKSTEKDAKIPAEGDGAGAAQSSDNKSAPKEE